MSPLLRSFLCLSLLTVGVELIAVAQTTPKPEYLSGVAVGTRGTIYLIDQQAPAIFRVGEGGKLGVVYQGSKKSGTPLYRPKALVEDSTGTLFICDVGTADVWRISPDGTKLSPLTGEKLDSQDSGPSAKSFDPQARYGGKLAQPQGITTDSEGNLIIADPGLGAVLRLPPSGGNPVELAQIATPVGIARDRDGSFVVVSRGADQLVRVSSQGKVTPIVRGALAPKSLEGYPHHVLVDRQGYVVSDGYARALWRVTPDGKVTALVQGDPLKNPVGIALEPNGNILVVDTAANVLFRVSPDGKVTRFLSFE
ncbi:MAG: hypothetical protein FJW26_03255 [Acidimicrobiia bacterium]|nr:hypothetical protein [Acidimicrobiia bacterium]